MTDTNRVTAVVQTLDGRRLAVYSKQQTASSSKTCEGCGEEIGAGSTYLRTSLVVERQGEDLTDHRQARAVANERRTVLTTHVKEECHRWAK